jgi:hypothetical protein
LFSKGIGDSRADFLISVDPIYTVTKEKPGTVGEIAFPLLSKVSQQKAIVAAVDPTRALDSG